MKKKKVNLSYLPIIIAIIFGAFIGFFVDKTSFSELFHGNIFTIIIILFELYLSIFLQVIIHELGHLFFGLMTGYKFLSYRIGSLMIIKKDNKFKLKKMSLMGTSGQCLMAPPNYNNGIPFLLYNLGGVIFNVISFVIFIVLYLNTSIFLIKTFSLVMAMVGLFYAIVNGVPLGLEVNNDGYNVFLLLKNKEAIYYFWLQMKINEELLNGTRLKDMNDVWFNKVNTKVNNCLINTIEVFNCNRLMDNKKFNEAYKKMDDILTSDLKIVDIHRFLLIIDCIYCELVLNNNNKYINMYNDNKLQRFITLMKNYPTVLRVNYAYARLKENDLIKSEQIKNKFLKISLNYPYECDIKSELELLDYVDIILKKK